ncbi:hypothetical protein Q7P35_005518 [Cladosporium inversicolor]
MCSTAGAELWLRSSHYRNAASQLRKAVSSRSSQWLTVVANIAHTHHYVLIMEVAGSAVGIASLGIEVCRGLLSYYDAWKGRDSDISSTYDMITDLGKTLTILKTALREEVDRERVGRVDTCVEGCEDALLKLDEKWRSLRNYGQPSGLRQKMRAGLQRTWYPFRKETLEALKASVTDVQGRLKLALQVLQLDIGTESQRLLLRLMIQATAQHDLAAQIAAQNQRILDAQKSDEFRKIVAWLTPSDPGTNHDVARRRHESQTGEWLLKSKQYQSWKTGAVSHLWINGKAGCGKTVLCSTAIEDIRAASEQDAATAFAFFYFSFSDERKQSDSDLLRSLVAQLGWREPGLSMLRQAYGDAKRSVPGPDELEKIFLASTRSCSKVYLLVDALDECPEDHDTRQSLLARIERLTQDAPNLRVLATSRELDRIRKSMEALSAEPLRVTTRAVDDDIQLYLAREISRDRSLCELSPEMRTLIESTIASQADGMFRWAYCQLQELKNLDSYKPKYVKQVLQTLPPTLDDTYTRMLTRIKTMYHQEALTLLYWLAYARSPPTLGELVDAAITDPAEESFIDISERGGLGDALNILSGLVTIEENQVTDTKNYSRAEFVPNDTSATSDSQATSTFDSQRLTMDTRVRLAHFSVKEYLESHRILHSDARQFHLESVMGHGILASSCLTYLRYYSSSSELKAVKRAVQGFPLLRYAARSWAYHSALYANNDFVRETSFLQSETVKNDWLLVYDPDNPDEPPFQSPDDVGSSLYYASRLGLEPVVFNLLRNGDDVNAKGGRFGNALQAASVGGFVDLVQLLVVQGADVNAIGGEYDTALHAASESGHVAVVNLLLEKGADVNALDRDDGTSLQAASRGGHLAVVQGLLDNNASVNTISGEYGSALQAASLEGHADVARLLLEKGAEIFAEGGQHGSALVAASAEGCTDVVELLTHELVKYHAGPAEFRNALEAASVEGFLDVVQILLDGGASVHWEGGDFGSALQAASYGGCEEVVELLLNKAADPTIRGGRYGTALQAASVQGHTKVAQMLLERGADVNAQGGIYGSALQAAALGVHEVILQLLLSDDAFGEPSLMHYNEAFRKASDGDHRVVLQLLLNWGADVNAQGGEYGSAVQAAAAGGHTETVQLLADSGADVNVQGGRYGSALEAAAAQGHTETVQLLQSLGALAITQNSKHEIDV